MDNTQDKSKSKASKVGGTILNILLWIFVVFAVVVTVFVFSAQKDADGVPSLFGNSYISIVSDSMAPEIRTGDMIVVKKVSGMPEAAQCQVGDIITFYSSQDINGDGKVGNDIETHAIVNVRQSGGFTYYITMGTNEEYSHGIADPEIMSTSVIGIYTGTRIPGLGSVVSFLGSSTGFLVCIVIPLAIFFLYELIHFVVLFIKVKGPKEAKAGITAADEEEIKRKAIEEYLAKQSAAAATSQGTEPEKDAPVEESAVESGEQASDETVEQPEEKSEEPVEEASEEVAEAPAEEAEVPAEEAEEQAESTEFDSSDVDESKKDDSKTE
ncbi:MAG: signal peptidase I [Clostridiales bacterium]|nr:signal peptidase I [Clostridiales bacterium]